MARRAIAIGIGSAVVVGHIERVGAAIIHGGADVPSVGLRAVFQHPASILNGILKVAGVGENAHRLARQRAGGNLGIETGIIRAESSQSEVVDGIGREIGDGVGRSINLDNAIVDREKP